MQPNGMGGATERGRSERGGGGGVLPNAPPQAGAMHAWRRPHPPALGSTWWLRSRSWSKALCRHSLRPSKGRVGERHTLAAARLQHARFARTERHAPLPFPLPKKFSQERSAASSPLLSCLPPRRRRERTSLPPQPTTPLPPPLAGAGPLASPPTYCDDGCEGEVAGHKPARGVAGSQQVDILDHCRAGRCAGVVCRAQAVWFLDHCRARQGRVV